MAVVGASTFLNRSLRHEFLSLQILLLRSNCNLCLLPAVRVVSITIIMLLVDHSKAQPVKQWTWHGLHRHLFLDLGWNRVTLTHFLSLSRGVNRGHDIAELILLLQLLHHLLLLVELCLLDCHLLIERKPLAFEPRLLLFCLLWLLLVIVMLIGALLNNGVVLDSLLTVSHLLIFCLRDAWLLVWAFLLRTRDFGIRSIHQDIDIVCNRQITWPSILNLVWTVSSFSFLRCSLRLRNGACVDAFESVDKITD